jgi:hypothetical protein
MSYPYPQDRHRDRREKGDQPYKDEREAFARNDAELQTQAEEFGESRREESADQRLGRIEAEAEERLKSVQEERSAGS